MSCSLPESDEYVCVDGGPSTSDVIPPYPKVTSLCVLVVDLLSDVMLPSKSDEYVCVLDVQSDFMPCLK